MNKTVLITGASRGIGKAMVYAFAEQNYNVILNYNKSADEAEKIAKELSHANILLQKADVSIKSEVNSMIINALDKYKKIDVLINNAGIAQQALFSDITEEMWDRMFDINVKGTYNCIQAVLPNMIHNKYGKIINVSSMWGITGASCEVHYSASKSAVIGLTKALAKEVGLSGITVNCIAPGVIDTEMNKKLTKEDIEALKDETPMNRIGTVNDVANAALFLSSDRSDFITGQVISVNGGIVI